MAKKSNAKIRQLHALQKKNTKHNQWLAQDATMKMPHPEELQQRLMDAGVEYALALEIITGMSQEMGGYGIASLVFNGTQRYSVGRDPQSCELLKAQMPKLVDILVGNFYPDVLSEAKHALDELRKATT